MHKDINAVTDCLFYVSYRILQQIISQYVLIEHVHHKKELVLDLRQFDSVTNGQSRSSQNSINLKPEIIQIYFKICLHVQQFFSTIC